MGEEEFKLAEKYKKGDGVKRDLTKAFESFLKSAEKGNVRGMFEVGLCYSRGRGVAEDKAKAFEW